MSAAANPVTESSARLGRAGGVAALVQAATFVVGMVLYVTLIAAGGYGDLAVPAAEQVTFLGDNRAVLHLWYAVIYLVFGTFLVVHALALRERLRPLAPAMAQVATAFAMVWAVLMFGVGMTAIVGGHMVTQIAAGSPDQAASLWLAMHMVVTGMGGGIELVGALWVGLVSLAALRTGTLPGWLSWLGIVAGVAGVVSTGVVGVEAVGAVFGLALIAWYIGTGLVMIRADRSPSAP